MVDAVLALGIIRDIIQHLSRQLNVIVRKLANLGIVDTQDLSLLGSSEGKTRDQVHDEEDDAGSPERVDTAGDGIGELVSELDPVAVEPSSRDDGETIQVCYVISGEESGEDVANETSDSVLSEDIKSVVDTEDELELGCVVGSCGSHNTVDDCCPGWDETRTGSDGYETSDDTGAESDGGPFAFKAVIKDTPGDTSNTGGQVGNDCGHDCAHIGCES